MSSQAENTPALPTPETVVTQQAYVKFRNIHVDPAANSYRDPEDWTDEAITSLAEDMLSHGLLTPWLVQVQADGTCKGHDCHRRHAAVLFNIKRGAAGFHLNMEIPVVLLPVTASELAVVKRAVASNIQRLAFSDVGKIRAAVRLKHLGATNIEIAQTLGTSDSTISRLLTLGTNPVWLQHVIEHNVSFSTAVRLLQVAEAEERTGALNKAFDDWCEDTRAAVEAEDNRRRADDETSLTIAEKYLQRYLKAEQVDGWIDQLRSGRPLGAPEFRFKAMIRKGKGPRRLEIDGISKDLDGLSLEALGKIAGRIADLDLDLKQALKARHAAEQQGEAASETADEERPSQRLWKQFGLQRLLDSEQAEEPTDLDHGFRMKGPPPDASFTGPEGF